MKRFFQILVLSAFGFWGSNLNIFAQNTTMANGSVNLCGGVLLDPGGLANYGNNLLITTTLCPSSPGSFVKLDFTSFNLEANFDFLTIYNGPSIASPIIGNYSGVLAPFFVQSTDPSGCLTLVFQTDASGTFSGFSSNISCIFPCQTIIANLTSSTPPATVGFIDLCVGQSLSVTGAGTYPNSPGNYVQSNATSTFEWNFGDLTSVSQATASHIYTSPGVYDLDLTITDINSCTNANDINIKVRVSGKPNFAGTNAASNDICLGQSNTLSGFVQPMTLEYFCESVGTDTTVIPDGVGVSYTNDLNLDCFNAAATVTNANDISSICIDIEHSYIHDLDITLTCPNGTSIDLYVTYPGAVNNVQFGQPVDNDLSATLGNPYNYCFTNTATNTIYSIAEPTVGLPPVQNYVDNDATAVAGAFYIPAGNYLPDQGFANLIGCPLNGDWTISITDNLNSDNGTIFNWSIDFNPSLYATNNNFTPSVNGAWSPDPTITANVGNTITVVPVTQGQNCYTFESIDQFGCIYDTLICFNASPSDDASFSYSQTQYCTGGLSPTPLITGTPGGVFNAIGGLPLDPLTGQIDLSTATIGSYTVSYSTSSVSCPASSSLVIDIIGATANFSADVTSGCAPLSVNFTNLSMNSVNCIWNFGDGTNGSGCGVTNHVYAVGGTFSPSLTMTDNNGCTATITQSNLITPEIQPIASFVPTPSELSVNDQTSTMVNNSTGANSYLWVFPGNQTSNAASPVFTFDLTESETAQVVLYAYSVNGCVDSAFVNIALSEELIFYAPNTFTPNNDEHNSTFLPIMTQGFAPASYRLTIFNRWGEVVFTSEDTTVGWDGTNRTGRIAPDGVYIYKIEYSRKNVDDPETFEGHVNLLR
jgi:gliding motility-associated-like protein